MKLAQNLFNVFNGYTIVQVPFFQRNYVWNESNWDMFLSGIDGMKNDPRAGYFMGSLILKQESTSLYDYGTIRDVRTLIDGQQRVTTVILFFYALCQVFDAVDDFEKSSFMLKSAGLDIAFKHNQNDRDAFNAILSGSNPENRGTKIYKCYEYFKDHLTTNKEKFNFINPKNTTNIITRLEFVSIELDAQDNEQQIFDVLNSGGVPLTTADLLKNWLFNRDEKKYRETWYAMFEEGEKLEYWSRKIYAGRIQKEVIDIFLQSYLIIFSKQSEYLKFEDLFSSYKEKIGDNKEVHIANIIKYAKIFVKDIDFDVEAEVIDKDDYLSRILLFSFQTNTTTIIPYLLYIILENQNDRNEINLICKLLEKYLIRRLICKSGTKNYNNMFVSFIHHKCNTQKALLNIISGYKEETNSMPELDNILREIKIRKFSNNDAKLILYLLELALSDDMNTHQAKPFRTDCRVELEHIIPKEWEQNWNIVISQENEGNIYRIGNMTLVLSKLNKLISNEKWEIKLEGKNGKLGLKTNASNWKTLDSNKYLNNGKQFNISSIEDRTNELAEYVRVVWAD